VNKSLCLAHTEENVPGGLES